MVAGEQAGMVRALGLAMLLALVGCSDPPPAASDASAPIVAAPAQRDTRAAPIVKEREAVERPQSPEQFVGKHVLVAAGTPLLVAAKPDAATLKLRTDAGTGARTFAVVAHEHGFLQLARAEPESRCDDGLSELDAFDPKLFVDPARVAAVLAREATVQFADGTSVGLRPGVAIEQEGPNGIVDAGGLTLAVAIDPRDVGTAFTPTMAPRPAEALAHVAGGSKLRYGEDKELVAGEPLFTDPRGVVVVSKKDDGADVLVEVLHGCATLRARIEPTALEEQRIEPMARAGMLGMAGLGMDPTYIHAAGAPVFWSDGTPAGKLALEQRVAIDKRAKSKKGKSCFLWGRADARIEPVEICVAAKHVRKDDPFASLYGTGLSALSAPSAPGAWGGLLGEPIEEAYGLGGLGIRGEAGRGGGGGGVGEGRLGGIGGSADLGGLDLPPTARVGVKAGPITTAGPLTAAKVKGKIGAVVNGVEYCAESESPVATGTLSITIAVADDGEPTKVTVSGIDAIESCVQRTLERWKLPAAAGTTDIAFALELTREDP
jgi:hypothetical protein